MLPGGVLAGQPAPTVSGRLLVRVVGCTFRIDELSTCYYDLRLGWSLATKDERDANPALSAVLDQLYFDVSRRYGNQFIAVFHLRICSRTLMGYSDPHPPHSLFSRSGRLLLLLLLTAALLMTSSHPEGTMTSKCFAREWTLLTLTTRHCRPLGWGGPF